MAAERTVGVVVLAVDVGGHRAADGGETGPRRDRDEVALRNGRPHQLVETHRGVDRGLATAAVDANRIAAGTGQHHDAATVLRGVAVRASQPAGDGAARAHRWQCSSGIATQLVEVDLDRGRHGRRGPSPAAERLGRVLGCQQSSSLRSNTAQYGHSGTGRPARSYRRPAPHDSATLSATFLTNHGSCASWRAALTGRSPGSSAATNTASERDRPM